MKVGDYVIVRSGQSGVHAGTLTHQEGDMATLTDSRRIWYWAGAASLSELAMTGPKRPGECKFAVVLPEIVVLGVCEIIPCSDAARCAIGGVAEWRA